MANFAVAFSNNHTLSMIHFDSDYMRGACPEIMQRLVATNLQQTTGYGTDPYTQHAKQLIIEACGLPDGEVELLVGGTQTNATVIDALLRRHEGVIAAETAHINVHEAGAIEASGHKVLTVASADGKIDAATVEKYITDFYADETYLHMVAPGMVYISHPTEYGTLYSRQELEQLSAVCRRAGIPLYVDGARLGYALGSDSNDITLADLGRLADAFYIGGTKVGALFGEAVVLNRRGRIPNFLTVVKQHGALLAKGRLLGLQFETLMTDGLYERLGRHGVEMAMKLKKGFLDAGYRLYIDSPTNQQFFLLPNTVIDRLLQSVSFELWGPRQPELTPVRFVTDWATTEADVDELIALLKN